MNDLPHGDAEGPAHHQHSHRGCEFLAREPVGHHLCEVNPAEEKADPTQDAANASNEKLSAIDARPPPTARAISPNVTRLRSTSGDLAGLLAAPVLDLEA